MPPLHQARAWLGVNGAILLIAYSTSLAAHLTKPASPLVSSFVAVTLTYLLVFAAASFNLRDRSRSTTHGSGAGKGEPVLRWHDVVWHPLAAVAEKAVWRLFSATVAAMAGAASTSATTVPTTTTTTAAAVVSAASPLLPPFSPFLASAASLLLRLFLFEVVYDLLFYWSHRLCHMPPLYAAVHKAHHRHKHGLTLMSTLNMSPADVLLTHSLPLLLALRVVPMRTDFEYQLAKAYLLFQEFYGHAGVQHKGRNFGPLPWVPTALGMDLRADDHQWHHIDGRFNFSKRFSLWDKVWPGGGGGGGGGGAVVILFPSTTHLNTSRFLVRGRNTAGPPADEAR